jgi:hypothetical protein
MRLDLTRWNRVGLTRFSYADGDAAVWLEELRIALLGLYLRDGEQDKEARRTPEAWRDLFLQEAEQWPAAEERARLLKDLAWDDLFVDFPVAPETADKRSRRLLEQYAHRSSDYTWEILRAFARASHVLLGHLDAYANEGYLRTATQWDNIRRLGAMVNYQPAPPASATTSVALLLSSEVDLAGGSVEIDRGLAMKYAPPAGGPPLIFETLRPIDAHPDLNAARALDWNFNAEPLALSSGTLWIAPTKALLAPGDLAVLADTAGLAVPSAATAIRRVDRDEENETAALGFEPTPQGAWISGSTLLMTEPADVRIGMPKTTTATLVAQIASAASYAVGSIIEVTGADGVAFLAVVEAAKDGFLYLATSERPSGAVTIEAFTPYGPSAEADFETPLDTEHLYFERSSGGGDPVIRVDSDGMRRETDEAGVEHDIANQYTAPADGGPVGYARSREARLETAEIVGVPPEVIPGTGSQADKTVRFGGKPPKGLTVGDWFAARALAGGDPKALRVEGVRTGSDIYYLEFHQAPPADADQTEFFGPMTRALRPVDWDRSQTDAFVGHEARLAGLSQAARQLLRPGRELIVDYDPGGTGEQRQAAKAQLTEIEHLAAGGRWISRVVLDGTASFAGWKAGWTCFRLNLADVSHGETKGQKLLGSGDGERARQSFHFGVKDISFVPSSASVTGVFPDIDVTVNGEKWEVRDDGDPTAEDTRSYSAIINEDNSLQIRFRRRLPTGTNNVAVSRHRLGVGAKGNGVPAWSFDKPMKKHRFVAGVVQPFATSGGAEREPVSSIRTNAPAKLAANDRAVSLADFERLCRRHASVWQAKAKQIIAPGPSRIVSLTIVPANGGETGEALRRDLIEFMTDRALPGVRVVIARFGGFNAMASYEALPVTVEVKAMVDVDRYDKTDVKDAAAAALIAAFSLEHRALGQPFYVAEILAELERVPGVASAVVHGFGPKPGAPQPLRATSIGGALAALFATDDQVIFVEHPADVAVMVEATSASAS